MSYTQIAIMAVILAALLDLFSDVPVIIDGHLEIGFQYSGQELAEPSETNDGHCFERSERGFHNYIIRLEPISKILQLAGGVFLR